MTIVGLVVALGVGIVLLVLAYQLVMPPPLRVLCLVFGYVLAIIGGLLLILLLLGVPVGLGARG